MKCIIILVKRIISNNRTHFDFEGCINKQNCRIVCGSDGTQDSQWWGIKILCRSLPGTNQKIWTLINCGCNRTVADVQQTEKKITLFAPKIGKRLIWKRSKGNWVAKFSDLTMCNLHYWGGGRLKSTVYVINLGSTAALKDDPVHHRLYRSNDLQKHH